MPARVHKNVVPPVAITRATKMALGKGGIVLGSRPTDNV